MNKMGVIMRRFTFAMVTLLCLSLVGCDNKDKPSVTTEEILSTETETSSVDITLDNSANGELSDFTASEDTPSDTTSETSSDDESDRNIFIRNDE